MRTELVRNLSRTVISLTGNREKDPFRSSKLEGVMKKVWRQMIVFGYYFAVHYCVQQIIVY